MTTTTEDTTTITMSERRPLKISKAAWPLIADVENYDGQVRCQANHEWCIRVREHDDGRRIVYGWQTAGAGGVHAGWRPRHAGYLLAPGHSEDELVRAIRRVGGVIGDDRLADACIADLPASEEA